MKVLLLVTLLLVTAHATSGRKYHFGIRHFFACKEYQRFIECLDTCRYRQMNRRTTMIPTTPFLPQTDNAPLTPNPPVPLTTKKRGDSLF